MYYARRDRRNGDVSGGVPVDGGISFAAVQRCIGLTSLTGACSALDFNGNDIPDEDDMAVGTSIDCNANDVPDECEYRGDFDGDRVTTLRDFAALQRCFTGDTPGITDPCCRLFDLNEDNTVNLGDLPGIQRVFAGP